MAIATGTAIALGAGASLLGGVIGNMSASEDRAQAERAMQAAYAEIEKLGAGPDLAREILLKNFEQVGVLTPELEEAVTLDAPKVAQIQEAPELRKAQMTALELIGQRATTGMGPEDRARLAEIQLQQARDTEAKRQQILQSYQQRGIAGAGSELAAQLQAASAGSAQAGEQGLQLAAQAQRSALEAAREYGALGGQIRGQEFGIAQTKAGAEDQASMARFNEALARQQRNVAARMGAQQYNLGTRQRIAEQNVAQQNVELQRQRAAEQQMYDNQVRVAQMRAQARLGQAGQYQQQAQQTAGAVQGAASGVSQALMYAGIYGGKDDKPTPTASASSVAPAAATAGAPVLPAVPKAPNPQIAVPFPIPSTDTGLGYEDYENQQSSLPYWMK